MSCKSSRNLINDIESFLRSVSVQPGRVSLSSLLDFVRKSIGTFFNDEFYRNSTVWDSQRCKTSLIVAADRISARIQHKPPVWAFTLAPSRPRPTELSTPHVPLFPGKAKPIKLQRRWSSETLELTNSNEVDNNVSSSNAERSNASLPSSSQSTELQAIRDVITALPPSFNSVSVPQVEPGPNANEFTSPYRQQTRVPSPNPTAAAAAILAVSPSDCEYRSFADPSLSGSLAPTLACTGSTSTADVAQFAFANPTQPTMASPAHASDSNAAAGWSDLSDLLQSLASAPPRFPHSETAVGTQPSSLRCDASAVASVSSEEQQFLAALISNLTSSVPLPVMVSNCAPRPDLCHFNGNESELQNPDNTSHVDTQFSSPSAMVDARSQTCGLAPSCLFPAYTCSSVSLASLGSLLPPAQSVGNLPTAAGQSGSATETSGYPTTGPAQGGTTNVPSRGPWTTAPTINVFQNCVVSIQTSDSLAALTNGCSNAAVSHMPLPNCNRATLPTDLSLENAPCSATIPASLMSGAVPETPDTPSTDPDFGLNDNDNSGDLDHYCDSIESPRLQLEILERFDHSVPLSRYNPSQHDGLSSSSGDQSSTFIEGILPKDTDPLFHMCSPNSVECESRRRTRRLIPLLFPFVKIGSCGDKLKRDILPQIVEAKATYKVNPNMFVGAWTLSGQCNDNFRSTSTSLFCVTCPVKAWATSHLRTPPPTKEDYRFSNFGQASRHVLSQGHSERVSWLMEQRNSIKNFFEGRTKESSVSPLAQPSHSPPPPGWTNACMGLVSRELEFLHNPSKPLGCSGLSTTPQAYYSGESFDVRGLQIFGTIRSPSCKRFGTAQPDGSYSCSDCLDLLRQDWMRRRISRHNIKSTDSRRAPLSSLNNKRLRDACEDERAQNRRIVALLSAEQRRNSVLTSKLETREQLLRSVSPEHFMSKELVPNSADRISATHQLFDGLLQNALRTALTGRRYSPLMRDIAGLLRPALGPSLWKPIAKLLGLPMEWSTAANSASVGFDIGFIEKCFSFLDQFRIGRDEVLLVTGDSVRITRRVEEVVLPETETGPSRVVLCGEASPLSELQTTNLSLTNIHTDCLIRPVPPPYPGESEYAALDNYVSSVSTADSSGHNRLSSKLHVMTLNSIFSPSPSVFCCAVPEPVSDFTHDKVGNMLLLVLRNMEREGVKRIGGWCSDTGGCLLALLRKLATPGSFENADLLNIGFSPLQPFVAPLLSKATGGFIALPDPPHVTRSGLRMLQSESSPLTMYVEDSGSMIASTAPLRLLYSDMREGKRPYSLTDLSAGDAWNMKTDSALAVFSPDTERLLSDRRHDLPGANPLLFFIKIVNSVLGPFRQGSAAGNPISQIKSVMFGLSLLELWKLYLTKSGLNLYPQQETDTQPKRKGHFVTPAFYQSIRQIGWGCVNIHLTYYLLHGKSGDWVEACNSLLRYHTLDLEQAFGWLQGKTTFMTTTYDTPTLVEALRRLGVLQNSVASKFNIEKATEGEVMFSKARNVKSRKTQHSPKQPSESEEYYYPAKFSEFKSAIGVCVSAALDDAKKEFSNLLPEAARVIECSIPESVVLTDKPHPSLNLFTGESLDSVPYDSLIMQLKFAQKKQKRRPRASPSHVVLSLSTSPATLENTIRNPTESASLQAVLSNQPSSAATKTADNQGNATCDPTAPAPLSQLPASGQIASGYNITLLSAHKMFPKSLNSDSSLDSKQSSGACPPTPASDISADRTLESSLTGTREMQPQTNIVPRITWVQATEQVASRHRQYTEYLTKVHLAIVTSCNKEFANDVTLIQEFAQLKKSLAGDHDALGEPVFRQLDTTDAALTTVPTWDCMRKFLPRDIVLAPPDRDPFPMQATGDGDCLLHSLSLCMSGTEEFSLELRVYLTKFLVEQWETVLFDPSYNLVDMERNSRLSHLQISSTFATGRQSEQCERAVALGHFIINASQPRVYLGLPEMQILAHVLRRNISSVFMDVRNYHQRSAYNRACLAHPPSHLPPFFVFWTRMSPASVSQMVIREDQHFNVKNGVQLGFNHFVPVRFDRPSTLTGSRRVIEQARVEPRKKQKISENTVCAVKEDGFPPREPPVLPMEPTLPIGTVTTACRTASMLCKSRTAQYETFLKLVHTTLLSSCNKVFATTSDAEEALAVVKSLTATSRSALGIPCFRMFKSEEHTPLTPIAADLAMSLLLPADIRSALSGSPVALRSTGDGNCLTNTVSLCLSGTEDFSLELRVSLLAEMIENYDYLLSDHDGFCLRYGDEAEGLNAFRVSERRDSEASKTRCWRVRSLIEALVNASTLNAYLTIIHVQVLARVIDRSISSIFMDVPTAVLPSETRRAYHRLCPADSSAPPLFVFWTQTSAGSVGRYLGIRSGRLYARRGVTSFKCNHFVPVRFDHPDASMPIPPCLVETRTDEQINSDIADSDKKLLETVTEPPDEDEDSDERLLLLPSRSTTSQPPAGNSNPPQPPPNPKPSQPQQSQENSECISGGGVDSNSNPSPKISQPGKAKQRSFPYWIELNGQKMPLATALRLLQGPREWVSKNRGQRYIVATHLPFRRIAGSGDVVVGRVYVVIHDTALKTIWVCLLRKNNRNELSVSIEADPTAYIAWNMVTVTDEVVSLPSVVQCPECQLKDLMFLTELGFDKDRRLDTKSQLRLSELQRACDGPVESGGLAFEESLLDKINAVRVKGGEPEVEVLWRGTTRPKWVAVQEMFDLGYHIQTMAALKEYDKICAATRSSVRPSRTASSLSSRVQYKMERSEGSQTAVDSR